MLPGDSASSETTTVTPADIVLVMDKSGSMQDKNDNRDTNAKNAANKLAGEITDRGEFQIIGISTSPNGGCDIQRQGLD